MNNQVPPNSGPGLIESDLQSFFGELLSEAADRKNKSFSQNGIEYVSKVLAGFQVAENFFNQKEAKFPILTDLLAEAAEADVYRRIALFRQLGDTSLMVSGCFAEAVARRAMDISYYYQMGESAYSNLSQMSESESVYSELSEAFSEYAILVNAVFSELRVSALSAQDLLDYYQDKDSEEALSRLREMGVVPIDTAKASDE